MKRITYAEIRARVTQPYTMSFPTGYDDCAVVMKCVNMGIDSYLEACFVPSRGDSYKIVPDIIGKRLECVVSKESLPVLIRRLTELEYIGRDGDDNDIGGSLATGILESLDFEVETGCYEIVTH